MKTRILSAVVLVPFLFLVVLVLDEIVATAVMALMMAIGAYELVYRTRLVRHNRLVLYCCVMAFSMAIWSYLGAVQAWLLLMVLVYVMLLFMEMMLDHVKVRFETLAVCFYAGFLVPWLLTSLIRILMMSIGRYVILIPFVVAFISDGGAYFVGFLGGGGKSISKRVTGREAINADMKPSFVDSVSAFIRIMLNFFFPARGIRRQYTSFRSLYRALSSGHLSVCAYPISEVRR